MASPGRGRRRRIRLQPRAGGRQRFEVALRDAEVTLVSFGAPDHGIAAPRRRRLISDNPRILARDDRAAHLAAEPEPPR
jgi:hypothetical protein